MAIHNSNSFFNSDNRPATAVTTDLVTDKVIRPLNEMISTVSKLCSMTDALGSASPNAAANKKARIVLQRCGENIAGIINPVAQVEQKADSSDNSEALGSATKSPSFF